MATFEFRTATAEDRSSITIEIIVDEVSIGHAVMDARELDGFIMSLSLHRAGLKERVADEPDADLPSVPYPDWRISQADADGDRLLGFRHPGFGWLGFLLDEDSLQEIREVLNRHPGTLKS